MNCKLFKKQVVPITYFYNMYCFNYMFLKGKNT